MMQDLYWTTVLQQEKITDDYRGLDVTFTKLVQSPITAKLLEPINQANAPSSPRSDKVILEPSIRLTALKKITKMISGIVADAESNAAQIDDIAEKLESCAYKKSSDLDDYYNNISSFIDRFLFNDHLPPRSAPGLFSPTAEVQQQVDRNSVKSVLKSYLFPFQSLLIEISQQLNELEKVSPTAWTREEKDLPNVHKEMSSVYHLLVSVVRDADPSVVTTETLVNMQKQIDYWLSLRSKFPIPSSTSSLQKPTPDSHPVHERKILPRPSIVAPTRSCTPNAASNADKPLFNASFNKSFPTKSEPNDMLPSFFASSTFPRLPEVAPTGPACVLPPFNPQKLPLLGSQPLLQSNNRGGSALFSSTPRVSFSRRVSVDGEERDYKLQVISNLSGLQEKEENENRPGSAEVSPSASLRRACARGRRGKVASSFGDNFEFNEDMNGSDSEHAFILSKLAEVMGGRGEELILETKTVSSSKLTTAPSPRRSKRARTAPLGKVVPGESRLAKKAKTLRYEFEMQLPRSESQRLSC